MKRFAMSIRGFAAMAALGMILACGNYISKTTDPVKLGNLAAAVEAASPLEADRLLAQEGYDETSFRVVIEEIMEDPDRVVKFSEAYNAAKG